MKFVTLAAFVLGTTTVAEEICFLPLDVMFLQDTTGSFEDDLPIVLRQIPSIVDEINAVHPGTWFGVAEFKDKPYFPLGETTDFCYKLGDGKLSPEMSDFEWAYSLLYASGGADLPEAQFQALIDLALDPAVGWRPLATERAAEEGEAGARIIIMSTDAPPHLPGDVAKYSQAQYPQLPSNLPANSGAISTGDVDYECLFQDYPSDLQMAAALKSQNIHLVILTPNQANITSVWSWVNEDLLGQPAGFYEFISEDSSDILDAVLKTVASVTEYACPLISSTTEMETMPSLLPPATGSTSATTLPETSTDLTTTPATTPEQPTPCPPCPTCPPCTEEPCVCPPCDPCNHGIIIKISDKVNKLSLRVE